MDPTAEWRAWLASPADVDDLMRLVDLLAVAPELALGGLLSSLSDGVVRTLLTSDDSSLRERLVPPIESALQRALPATPPDSEILGLGLVQGSTLVAACGRGGDPGAVLDRWIPAALAGAGLPDSYRTSYALACAAHARDAALHELVGEPPMTFVPDAKFGPDARSYARYVAAAAAAGAPVSDIERAWTSFVAFFPVRLETGGLRWTDLLFAGYAAYVRIAGADPADVMDRIGEFVREMAAA